MANLVNIGKLSFSRDSVEKGHYGKVFRGRFEDAVNVTISRVDKSEISVDTKMLRSMDQHFNIVRFYGATEDDEFQYVAFEQCCATLKQFVRGECTIPLIPDNKEILRQITAGLEYLHAGNICHRDLKPSNIFISQPNANLLPQMKLGGFGFTRLSKTPLPLWKQVGTNKGWMAPEIYDLKIFTTAMDIFSLGLVFAFVLSGGLHAFGTNKHENICNMKEKLPMTLTVHQLKNVGAGVAGVFELICTMLSYNPEERPGATMAFNYAYFNKSSFIQAQPIASTSRVQVPVEEPRIKNEPTDDPIEICQSTTRENESLIPPLMPIREPSGEPLPKKMRQEENLHQQIPTPPLSVSPNSLQSENFTSPFSTVASTSFQQGTVRLSFIPDPKEPSPIPPSSSAPHLTEPLTSENERQVTPKRKRPTTPPEAPRSRSPGSPEYRDRHSDRSPVTKQRFHKKEKELSMLCSRSKHTAVNFNHIRELLMDRSVDINWIAKRHFDTPIVRLCRSNKSDSLFPLLEILLQRDDLNIDAIDCKGLNALMVLCHNYYGKDLIECCRLLINRGIQLDIKRGSPRNPTSILWENDRKSESRELWSVIKNRNLVSNEQKERELLDLCYLSEMDDEAARRFRLLVSNRNLNLNCREATTGRTPLLLLCYHHQSDKLFHLVQFLIGYKNVRVNFEDHDGWNALLTVCFRYRGNCLLDIVGLFIRREMDVNCANKGGGWNSLFALTSDTNFSRSTALFDVVELLVDNGLDLNAKDTTGSTVLYHLTMKLRHHPEFVDIVRLLVKKGLDVNATNNKRQNVIFALCETIDLRLANDRQLIETVEFLLEFGIRVLSKDAAGLNIFDVLDKRGFHKDCELTRLLFKSQKL